MTMYRFLTAALVMLAGAAQLPAQAASDLDDDDRPGRGVARISLINGDVSVKRGDSDDMTAAAINAPLVAADHLYAGAGSRAELQFDSASFVRLAANGELGLAELEQNRYTIQLARGLMTLRVLRERRADIEVSTPSIAIRPLREGIYRIEVRDDGNTEVTVRSGETEILSPQGSEKLRRGRTLLVRGATSSPQFKEVNDIPEDDWDRWNERRDKGLLRSRSHQYVSSDIYGVEDLDAHGRWVNVPRYGYVWTPYVAAGWAPYRQGRWAWIDWYGWSWVSYDPWGWAPYHYGRWFNEPGFGWCWWPGARTSRHWWRPALVGFFGWGGNSGFRVDVGFGFGNVGWIPLAPYERFHPWYGRRFYGGYRNNTYIDNSVRIVNSVNITNVYRNARVRNGVSGLDAGDFVGGRGNRVRSVGDTELRSAASIEGRVPIVPDRQSLRLADREVAPRGNNGRGETRFFGRAANANTEATRASFDDQRRGMEQVARRTFGDSDGGGVRTSGDSGRRSAEGGDAAVTAPGRRGGEDRRSGGEPTAGTFTGRRGGEEGTSNESGRRNAGGEPAAVSPDGGRRGGDDNGWRRVGESGRRSSGSERTVAPSDSGRRGGDDNGGWRGV
ncbi:MAG: hypothetical protein FJW31_09675, partial [Acidobacteria bacterium]|nr:hypothetical protein [Acidobacteriota bacterium]